MAKFEKLFELGTTYSADSVEWCPIEGFKNIFVCGTYQLSESENRAEKQERLGKLFLFRLTCDPHPLKLLQTLEMPGILDMKWAQVTLFEKILLAIANSVGRVEIYELKTDNHLEYLCSYELGSEDILSLSLDWSISQNVNIAVSDSKGFITVLSLQNSDLTEEIKLKSHGFEAWIVCFNYWNPKIIYTGGDDCKMNIYDTSISTERPVMISKVHDSGVTSMQCNPRKENSFVSGSYDENIRFWDLRNMKCPTNSIAVGGGVWRLKWEPKEGQDLLAACMYNGFAAVDTIEHTVLSEYKEHSSIGYGIDWCHLQFNQLSYFLPAAENHKKSYLISACSFYDCKLSLAILQR